MSTSSASRCSHNVLTCMCVLCVCVHVCCMYVCGKLCVVCVCNMCPSVCYMCVVSYVLCVHASVHLYAGEYVNLIGHEAILQLLLKPWIYKV